MKYIKGLLLLSVLVTLVSNVTFAQEIAPAKKKAIKELIEISGAKQMGSQFSKFFVSQMTMVLKQSKPGLPDRAFEIIKEVVNETVDKEIKSETLVNLLSPVYNKYYSVGEINEIIKFYKTPVGSKLVKTMPDVTRESMQIGQKWGQGLGFSIQKELMTRFRLEGINIDGTSKK